MNPVSDLRVDVMDDEILVGLPGRTILLRKLSGKSGVTFYLWCTGCRIPFHACLFTGRLVFGRRCSEANCENEGKDCHKAFHGASPSIVLRAEAQQVGRRSARQTPVKALSRVARCPVLRARLFHAAKATA